MKHVKTEPPHDSSIRFEQIEADGSLMYVVGQGRQPARMSTAVALAPGRVVAVAVSNLVTTSAPTSARQHGVAA
jgi:hypothetical protein